MLSILRATALGTVAALSFTFAAFAAGPEINATSTGLALRGYDPVSYFTDGAPAKGNFEITAEYDGAFYRFTSESNRDAFLAEPTKYTPQYGGYCAMGTAMGMKLDGDPEVWSIVDDKLYLNVAPSIGEKWRAETATLIPQADTKWTEIAEKDPSDL